MLPLTCRNMRQRCAVSAGVERRCKAKARPAMSDQRPEVGDRSAVKTLLTSARLECPLIVPASGSFVAAFWMPNYRRVPGRDELGR
jgi:hypothetical protein